MPLSGEYEPSPSEWVRNQVEAYEASGGAEANTLRDIGNKSGKIRKTPLMRVEHDGSYALVASKGGAPTHPVWYHNLAGRPTEISIQDGAEPHDFVTHEATGGEKDEWWERAVAAYPPYAEYQAKTERTIPLFVATPKG